MTIFRMSLAVALALVLCDLMPVLASEWPESRITVKVLTADGTVVSNAQVHIGFPQGGNAWIGERKEKLVTGTSDSNGCFSAQAPSENGIGGSVEKKGYYRSFWKYAFEGNYQEVKRWEPWNPTIGVTLQKVGKPVAMYAKRVDALIPEVNTSCAYDLEKGDWVNPHGKGIHADIRIELMRRITSENDYEGTLTVNFPGIGNGIKEAEVIGAAGSTLRLSPAPPPDSYGTNVVVQWGRTPSKGGYGNVGDDYRPNYFFRVRSEVDEKGNVIRAQYGKVYGAFRVSGLARKDARVSFLYYLNPDGTRNVEFDPKQNLFKNLSSLEEVRAP